MPYTNDHFLRSVMTADALVGALSSLLLLFVAGPMSATFSLPAEFLRSIGFLLAPLALYMLWVARRTTLSVASVWSLVVGNTLWVIGSALLLLNEWVQPNSVGMTFILSQAVVVSVFAQLEYMGLRNFKQAQS
jgi:hypothetical protein